MKSIIKVLILISVLLLASKLFAVECEEFADKLEKCEVYSCKFTHPFTGDILEKKIIGEEEGKCHYIEEMPNNGKMECKYSPDQRKAIAQFTKDSASAEVRTEVSATLEGAQTKYYIDGKEVENPMQEVLDSGACVISGYENITTIPSQQR